MVESAPRGPASSVEVDPVSGEEAPAAPGWQALDFRFR